MAQSTFDKVLAEFKAKETPEAILVVGDDPWMTRITLAWPNVALTAVEPEMKFNRHWDEVSCWNWLWLNTQYSEHNVWRVVGKQYLEAQLRALIANRILYPDGTVHSYVTRFLRDRVVKLLEKKPPARRTAKAQKQGALS